MRIIIILFLYFFFEDHIDIMCSDSLFFNNFKIKNQKCFNIIYFGNELIYYDDKKRFL